MRADVLQRSSIRCLALAWLLIFVGTVVLIGRYSTLPDSVVLYRVPWSVSAVLGPKSFVTVARIPLMGVGQLGAATAMCIASRGSTAWERFWRWLGLTAGAKTLLECVSLVTQHGTSAERAATWATLAVVLAFVLAAVWWWRRGDLRLAPPLRGSPRVWLVACIALWAVFSVAPRFL